MHAGQVTFGALDFDTVDDVGGDMQLDGLFEAR